MISQSKLLIKLLKYQIGLRRYEAGEVKEILKLIDKVEKESLKNIDDAVDIIKDRMPALPAYTEFTQHSIDVAMQDFSKMPSLAVIDRLYRPTFEGNFMADHWKRMSNDLQFKVKGVIRRGVIEGADKSQMTALLRGAFDGSRRHAAAIVQTTIHTIANDARLAVYEKNSDIIRGYFWLSTLDSRTTITCIGRSGLRWDINKNPIGHTVPFANPPIHWNCRSIMMPELIDFKDVGLNVEEPKGTRSSKLGQINKDISFDSFLKMLSKEEQEEQLGIGRADLWRKGVITTKQLLDGNGRELTLAELKAKYVN